MIAKQKHKRNVLSTWVAAIVIFTMSWAGVPSATAGLILTDADIIVTNISDHDISVVKNDGSRQFTRLIPDLSSANFPCCPSLGDVNNDFLADLVVVDGNNQNHLSLFLNQGNAQFGPRIPINLNFDVGENPAFGDFNEDGNVDLFINHWSGGGGSEVQILIGDGQGGFTIGATRSGVPGANAVAVGDFNEDDNLDGVVTNWTTAQVTVIFGNGTGGFMSSVNDLILPAFGSRPQNVVVGDFNNDNHLDFAFAHGLASKISVYLGIGNGTFEQRIDLAADAGNGGSGTVLVADFDHNGYDDLVGFQSSSILGVYLWDPQQNVFGPVVVSSIDNLVNVDDLAVADFDNDGRTDIVVTDRHNDKISIYFGDGTVHFGSKVDVAVGNDAVGVVVANLHMPSQATIGLDIDPNTLNVKSEGQYITAYLSGSTEIPAGQINVSTLKITKIEFPDDNVSLSINIPAELFPVGISDRDGDTIPDLMVKFNRATVIAEIGNNRGEAKFTINGKTNGGLNLIGTDSIRIK